MARGKMKYKRKDKKRHQKISKLKHGRKKIPTFRDMKHSYQFSKLKLENEKNEIEKEDFEIEDTQTKQVREDAFNLLLSSFKVIEKSSIKNIAIDSDESSEDEDERDEKENFVNVNDSTDCEVELYCFSEKENHVDNYISNQKDGNDSHLNNEDETDTIILTDNIDPEEFDSKLDPFHIHLNNNLSESLLESVSVFPMKTESFKLYWPVLHNLIVEIPKGDNETDKEEYDKLNVEEKIEYAKEYNPPILINSLNWNSLHIKSQIRNNILKANEKHAKVSSEFTELQKELFSIINNYQDLFYCERNLINGEEIRFLYCLHTVNHILKSRLKVLHHNERLLRKNKEQVPDEFRDQGLVRPKVIVIVPFRDSCLRIVKMLCSILLSEDRGNIINKKRFIEEFSGSELYMPKKNPKPEDYEELFKGNIDDNFRIGISFTKKSIKLFSDFYSSDLIICSPLGLRMVIGAEGDKKRDFDFLASIELLILDQAELFLMQNWEHLLLIFEHLHIQPKESHGTDFSRVRFWALNGWTKFYRQTLIFSSIVSSELNAIFNRKCFNYAGKVRIVNPIENGTICHVVVSLSHIFQRFQTNSAIDSVEERFQLFSEKIIPQYKDPVITGVLVYVPSYFDYVKIRNYLKKNDYNFVQICEYSKDAKVARARDMFFHKEARLLLYSERFHFFKRITLKGIRHVIFYQLPTMPYFYSEICNLMQEVNQNRFLSNDSGNMTVTVLYCKYDIHQLSAIVKTPRAAKMISSEKDTFLFTTG